MVIWCDNIGLLLLIPLGWELRVLYHCTMCTRHPDLVSLDFHAIPIFPFEEILHLHLSPLILIPNLLIILVQVSSNATSSEKNYVIGSLDYSCIYMYMYMYVEKIHLYMGSL